MNNKKIAAVVSMSLCSFAIACASNKSGVIVFVFAWIVGVFASILIQFIWYRKPFVSVFLVLITIIIALTAGLAVYFFAF